MKVLALWMCLFCIADAMRFHQAATVESDDAGQKMIQTLKDSVDARRGQNQARYNKLERESLIRSKRCELRIPNMQSKIEDLEDRANVAKNRAEQESAIAEKASADAADLRSDNAAMKEENEKLAAQNAATKAKGEATIAELQDTMAAVEAAMEALRQSAPDASFVQLPETLQSTILSLTQGTDLESSTGGVTETLQTLLDDFKAEFKQVTMEMHNTLSSVGMMMNANSANIKRNEDTIAELEASQQGANENANQARADEEKYLSDRDVMVARKKAEKGWCAHEKKVQETQMAFLAKSIQSLRDAAASLDKKISTTGFVQLSAHEPKEEEVARFLAHKAQDIKSEMLAQLVSRAETGGFDKILKMIVSMIKKLEKQGHEEEKHHQYCQAAQAENKDNVDRATRELTSAQGDRAQAQSRMGEATDSLQTLMASMSDAANEYAEFKSESIETEGDNKKKIADIQASETTLAAAKNILQSMTGEGMSIINNMVVKMIENLQEDRSDLESENEDLAQEMDKREQDEKLRVAQDGPQKKMYNQNIQESLAAEDKGKAEEKIANEKLAAANKVRDALKVQCDVPVLSREEKVAKMKEEIESLREAVQMLEG